MKIVKNIFLFLLTLTIVLWIGDLYLRMSGIQDPSNNKFDPTLGRIRRENFKYVKLNEGFSISNFNDYSYLGPSYSPEKPDSIIRIALLGDSYIEGFQVFERDHFRSITENKLNTQNKNRFELLNFGRSGLGFENMFALDSLMIRNFKPDYILYFAGINDFYSETKDPLIPGVDIINGSDIIVNNHFSEKAIKEIKLTYPILQKSALLSMLNNGRKLILSGKLDTILFDKFASKAELLTDSSEEPKVISLKIHKIIDRISIDPKIIIVNRSDESFSSEIVDLLSSNNIKIIDLSIVLTKLTENHINPHYWKATNKIGHWNQFTHKAIGKKLAKEILKIVEN